LHKTYRIRAESGELKGSAWSSRTGAREARYGRLLAGAKVVIADMPTRQALEDQLDGGPVLNHVTSEESVDAVDRAARNCPQRTAVS